MMFFHILIIVYQNHQLYNPRRKRWKYGLEDFGIGAEKLFGIEEAHLANDHAQKCYSATVQLREYLRCPW
jgi:hypothetical protein